MKKMCTLAKQQNPPLAVTNTIRAKKLNKQPCSTCSIKRKGMQPPSATETAMKKQLNVITSMQQTCTSITQSPCTLMRPVGI